MKGAGAVLCPEQLVPHRIVDHAGVGLAVALQPDGDREVGQPVQEVGGAVQRIDDPAVGAVLALDRAAFLEQEAEARARPAELRDQRLLRPVVGGGDEIRRSPFARPAGSRPRRSRGSGRAPPCRRR